MSVVVAISELPARLADFDTAYLLSSADGRIKVLSVVVVADGQQLVVPTESGGTARNLRENPVVTLVCPPREPSGLTLIVDGTAEADAEGFRMTPTSAILHRPATADPH